MSFFSDQYIFYGRIRISSWAYDVDGMAEMMGTIRGLSGNRTELPPNDYVFYEIDEENRVIQCEISTRSDGSLRIKTSIKCFVKTVTRNERELGYPDADRYELNCEMSKRLGMDLIHFITLQFS